MHLRRAHSESQVIKVYTITTESALTYAQSRITSLLFSPIRGEKLFAAATINPLSFQGEGRVRYNGEHGLRQWGHAWAEQKNDHECADLRCSQRDLISRITRSRSNKTSSFL